MNTVDERNPLLTDADVAKELRVPVSWVEKAARRGELTYRKFGRYRRYRMEDIDAFLDVSRVAGNNPLALSARSQANLRRARRTA